MNTHFERLTDGSIIVYVVMNLAQQYRPFTCYVKSLRILCPQALKEIAYQ